MVEYNTQIIHTCLDSKSQTDHLNHLRIAMWMVDRNWDSVLGITLALLSPKTADLAGSNHWILLKTIQQLWEWSKDRSNNQSKRDSIWNMMGKDVERNSTALSQSQAAAVNPKRSLQHRLVAICRGTSSRGKGPSERTSVVPTDGIHLSCSQRFKWSI